MGKARLARPVNPAHRVWHQRVSSLVSSSIDRCHNDLHARGVRWRSVGDGRFYLASELDHGIQSQPGCATSFFAFWRLLELFRFGVVIGALPDIAAFSDVRPWFWRESRRLADAQEQMSVMTGQEEIVQNAIDRLRLAHLCSALVGSCN